MRRLSLEGSLSVVGDLAGVKSLLTFHAPRNLLRPSSNYSGFPPNSDLNEMRYTCLMILGVTIVVAGIQWWCWSSIPPTDCEVVNSLRSCLIVISLMVVLGIFFEARLVRSIHLFEIRDYANDSKSLEYKHQHRDNVMHTFLDNYGEEMVRVQQVQVLDWEKAEVHKATIQDFKSDGIEIEKGHESRGLAFVRLVRSLLDIRIKLLVALQAFQKDTLNFLLPRAYVGIDPSYTNVGDIAEKIARNRRSVPNTTTELVVGRDFND
ncbi:hypothetical protein BKA65DRAFT_475212 [Rhexocercosporidium sp. MPI-PUGE-AT-0058]|nr:hypothetical protein BKA65DRAFT_475212 [Rhexocercosporidium sp. MPI-PUGE-AT-0058]